MSRTITLKTFHAEARARFGDNPQAWAFQCPECGDIATGPDVAYYLSQRPAGVAARNPVSVSQVLARECVACPARASESPHLDRVYDPATGHRAAVFPLAPKDTR